MLIDQFGRKIDYLRLSLTDRCNFRCTYCMPEDVQFAPRRENLALEELALIARAFVELGVEKIRLTGGEPLIHPDFDGLLRVLSRLHGLRHIALTTNGSLLAEKMPLISQSKVSQINLSLDSIQEQTFRAITRVGQLQQVLAGLDAAIAAGIERIRLNVVVSRGCNDGELEALLAFAIAKGVHIAFIEEMPLGDMKHYRRSEHFLSNEAVRQQLLGSYPLLAQTQKRQQAGPARYYQVPGKNTEVGFISPHSDNFCSSCNRVRVTRRGQMVLCLGQNDAVDLRQLMRGADDPLSALKTTIVDALMRKPESHRFDAEGDDWQVVRFMNVTGG